MTMELQNLIEEFPEVDPDMLSEMMKTETDGGFVYATECGILDGLRCPNCTKNESLRVTFSGEAVLSCEGSEDVGDHEWGHDSDMACRSCGYVDKARAFAYDHESRSWTHKPLTLEQQIREAQNKKSVVESEIDRLASLLLEVNNDEAEGQVYNVVVSETLTEVWHRDIVASSPREAAEIAYAFVVENGYWATPSMSISEFEREITVDGEFIDPEEEEEE